MAARHKAVVLSDLQMALMRVLWARGECSTAEVAEVLARERGIKHTTVATMLTRLEKRGVVSLRRDARQVHYQARVSEPEVRRSMVSELLGSLRELELAWKKPGDWKFSISYGETLREEPNRASTGADLQLKRSKVGVALLKTLGPQLQLDVSLSSENKDGLRLFGIGMNCPSAVAPGCGGTTGAQVGWAVLMLPEPVNANHSQIEARLSYTGDKLYVSAGYYGSFYQNQFGSLSPNVPGALNNAVGTPLPLAPGLQAILNQPVALPPDNQAHQIDLSGRYSFTPTTHLNFKLSHAQALQHDDFAAAGFTGAPAGVSNLGGRVDTTLAQLGLSARPWAKLTLQAKLRYEDTDDSTPIALYNVEDTATYTNRRLPGTKLRGQLQAHYQFSSDYRGTLGAEAESIDRGVFTATSAAAGITALRQKTDETTVRAELRRRMNEQLSGAISVSRSRRDGSNWLRDNSGTGVTEVPDASDPSTGFARGIFMPTLADRQRDKLRLQADWQPSDELSLQLSAQHGIDRFSTPSVYGVQTSGMDQFEFDASYALTERWSLNGNLSYGTETLRQARPDAAALAYDNTSSGFGVGITGKATSASSNAMRTSRVASRMFSSLRRPRPRRRSMVPERRWVRDSNMRGKPLLKRRRSIPARRIRRSPNRERFSDSAGYAKLRACGPLMSPSSFT